MQPLIAYTDTAAVDTLRYSTYSTSWSAEATGPDTNDNNLTWHVAKTAPVGREHVVLAASYTNKTLYAFLYNGSTWSTKNLGTINTTDYRCFNAAYEHASGDLVIAAATTTANQIKYWVWNGTSWVVDGGTYTFTTIDRTINWARMANQPGTNQVSLVVMDNDSDVVGLIWDGNVNTWGNEKKLGTATATRSRGHCRGVHAGQHLRRAGAFRLGAGHDPLQLDLDRDGLGRGGGQIEGRALGEHPLDQPGRRPQQRRHAGGPLE